MVVSLGVGDEVVEAVLGELPGDQRWDLGQAQVAAVAAGGVLCDGKGQQAIDVDVGAAGHVKEQVGPGSCWWLEIVWRR